MVLGIWNGRIQEVAKNFQELRTIVLVRAADLRSFLIFEEQTVPYDPQEFSWSWNKQNNLEGQSRTGEHRFTWQPHGSQFTIIRSVPKDATYFELPVPQPLNPESVLESIGFEESWVKIERL